MLPCLTLKSIRSGIGNRFLMCMMVLTFLSGCVQAQTKSQSPASSIYEHYHSAVVVVVTFDKDDKVTGQGSGFILSANRVVTNHHVLADSASAAVLFADGETAKVEGYVADNPTRDITIAVVKTGNRVPLKLGDELALKQGDYVYAIGAPRGLDLSITNGIVSGFRNIDDKFLLQTTAPIAPGSSGGPLFDSDGDVVGVTSSLLNDSPGIYFSVGIGDVSRIYRSASTLIMSLSSLTPTPKSESFARDTSETDSIGKLIDTKDYKSARARLRPLIEKLPNDPTLNRMLGQIDLFEGEAQASLSPLRIAVEGNPNDNISKSLYAVGLFLERNYSDASYYQKIVITANPSAENLSFFSEILYAQGKFSEAEKQAFAALEKDSTDSDALEVIAGNIYWGRSKARSWADIQQKLSKVKSDSFWVKIQNAGLLLAQKKEDEALPILISAKKDYFPDPAASYLASHIYIQKFQLGLARDEIESTLAVYPFNTQLLSQAMFVALMQRDETSASRHYSQLADIVGRGNAEELGAACLYYYGIGRSAEAIDKCSKNVSVNPKEHVAHSNLAWAALDADQFELAFREFSAAYNLVKDQWNQLRSTEQIDLTWGFAIASYYTKDKKTCRKLLHSLRIENPLSLTLTGLEQLPLVWSRKTTTRIELIVRDIRP